MLQFLIDWLWKNIQAIRLVVFWIAFV